MINTGKEHIDLILNDIEKAEVQRFADNTTMVEAIRKIFLKGVYFEGVLVQGEPANPQRNFALALADGQDRDTLSDEQLGRMVRARAEAMQLVGLGFNYVESFKSPVKEPVDNKKNPGR